MLNLEQKVYKKIDELTDKYINILIDICNIESKSDNKNGVDRVGDYLASVAKDLNYDIRKLKFENSGNVYSFTYNNAGSKKAISLSGHMDTVFEKGAFGYPPVSLQGDYIHAPGAVDCKGGIAVAMLAMEALMLCGYKERSIKLILQSDEEVGSCLSNKESVKFMVEEAKDSAMFINCEGHEKGILTVARKGIVKKKITIKGKACHAGACTAGLSAIKEAAYKIIEFEKDNDINSVTFNCGIINGGASINTVPDTCELYLEYRFKTRDEQQKAEEKFRHILNTSYIDGTESFAEEISSRAPMERTLFNEELVRTISQMAQNFGMGCLEMSESAGGTDSAYTTLANIPTVDSLGAIGEGCHTTGEKVLISSIPKMAKFIANVIINYDK